MGTFGAINGTNTGAASGIGGAPLQAMFGVADDAAQNAGFERPGDAGAVLQTGGSYIAFAEQAVATLDTQLQRRGDRLGRMQGAGADAATVQAEQRQLDLLAQLRDRISLSARRIRDILAGKDIEAEIAGDARPAAKQQRQESGSELQLRLEDLQQRARAQLVQPSEQAVARTYLGE